MPSSLEWSNGKSEVRNVVQEECSAPCLTNEDAALAASEYDRAINLYSAVIDLDSTSDIVFANRSKAKWGEKLRQQYLSPSEA
ncbi:hypothetical protein BD769DRAFT_1677626 [Suillus cothurnatus]|nr:hypothetical protein BD769DRAFT_1677626 [Suillus cothurnatus]